MPVRRRRTCPAPPPAPSRQSGRPAGQQQPETYDPYSFESYGPSDRDRDRDRGRGRDRDRTEPPAPTPPAPDVQPRRRQREQGYDEPAYAGYEQGYDQAYPQGYDYDEAYDRGYDDRYDERYDDAYDRSVGGDRRDRDGAFHESSGAAIAVHLTLVILAIWLTWAYGTSVI